MSRPAQKVCCDAEKLINISLPQNVSLDLGALVEPLSVAMHARDRAGLPEGATILVLGAGTIGVLAAAVSQAANAKAVVIADIQKERVDFAVRCGFADAGVIVPMVRPQTIEDKLLYAREVANLVKKTQIRGQAVGEVAAVYECTGVESCVQAAIYVRELKDFVRGERLTVCRLRSQEVKS